MTSRKAAKFAKGIAGHQSRVPVFAEDKLRACPAIVRRTQADLSSLVQLQSWPTTPPTFANFGEARWKVILLILTSTPLQ
ncbi:MAG TPA: hypothetical protein VMY18_10130 [Acidobacteriota bacterium]|nr:hypothetical protein [Acidobacteriota bacterium]